MLKFSVLSSGSRGNAVYINIDGYGFMLDCGLNCKTLQARLATINKSVSNINDVFIGHCHIDHIQGVEGVKKHCQGVDCFDGDRLKHGHQIVLGNIGITPFNLDHDVQCFGFLVEDGDNNKLAYVSDTGTIPCESLEYLLDLDAIILETNHDEAMLDKGPYPSSLQERVADTHLRNEQARGLLELITHDGLKFVICHHLSTKNNSSRLAEYEVKRGAGDNCEVVVATQDEPTKLFTLL